MHIAFLPGRRGNIVTLFRAVGLLYDRAKHFDFRANRVLNEGAPGPGWTTFLLFVVIPTLLVGFYFCFIASREFIAEARFVIRNANPSPIPQAAGDAMSLVRMLGASSGGTQDAFVVTNYIKGRTIIGDLGGKVRMEELYSRPNIDWWSRLAPESSFEDIWKYWRHKVTAIIDTRSGIITLEVRAFTREDANQVAKEIVALGERLVNEISERSRRDALTRAETELHDAQVRLHESRDQLLNFRNQQQLLDPQMSAQSIGDTLNQLVREKVELENDLATVAGLTSSNAPNQLLLRSRISNVDKQIADFRAKLAGNKLDTALSTQLATYENLQLQVRFMERLYEIAEAAYEKSRQELESQQLYVVMVVRPTMPERAIYPRRILNTLLTFVWSFVLWSIFALAIAGIRDHAA
jgi:capsular polysaccharide transport system permease protein